MPYQRAYDVSEIKGMLMIAEDSYNVVANAAFVKKLAAKGKAPKGAPPVAHSVGLHVGQTEADLSARTDTGPPATSSYKDFDTLVRATCEALNHANGQAALGNLDAGQNEDTFNAPLGGNAYFCSRAARQTKKKGTGLINNYPFMVASEAFVKISAYIGGRLWIQTSYPSMCNLRPAPTFADLP